MSETTVTEHFEETASEASESPTEASGSAGSLVVKSALKAATKARGLRLSGDAVDALNARVATLLDDAVARANANKRGTVRGYDF